jgi:hypothetical protein
MRIKYRYLDLKERTVKMSSGDPGLLIQQLNNVPLPATFFTGLWLSSQVSRIIRKNRKTTPEIKKEPHAGWRLSKRQRVIKSSLLSATADEEHYSSRGV